ncbi:MAG: hypothetical protein ACE15C_14650 [Phycisphaerae bacterium]
MLDFDNPQSAIRNPQSDASVPPSPPLPDGMSLVDTTAPAGTVVPKPAELPTLRRLPDLADDAREYQHRQRPSADPLGKAGLPNYREGLDGLLLELCRRLIAAGGAYIRARQLVEELKLDGGDRALRRLVAYGHVHHRLRQIVGVEGGQGYCWGESRAGAYALAATIARRKALCSLFNASLYSRKTPVIEMAQLALDFERGLAPMRVAHGPDGPPLGRPPAGDGDDPLDLLLAGEGVKPGQVIEALVSEMERTAEGKRVLAEIGERHRGAFVTREAAAAILAGLDRHAKELSDLRGRLAATLAGGQNA